MDQGTKVTVKHLDKRHWTRAHAEALSGKSGVVEKTNTDFSGDKMALIEFSAPVEVEGTLNPVTHFWVSFDELEVAV